MKLVRASVIAQALGIARQNVWKRAKAEHWVYQGTSRGHQYDFGSLPIELQLKISQLIPPERPTSMDKWPQRPALDMDVALKAATEHERDVLFCRAVMISEYEISNLNVSAFLAHYNEGCIPNLVEVFEKIGRVSQATFYRWLKNQRRNGTAAIIPQYQRRNATRTGSGLTIMEKGFLEYWYCNPEKPSIHSCWQTLIQQPGCIVTYAAAKGYLQSLPRVYTDSFRLGTSKWDNKYQPHIDRDPTLYAAMQQVVSDHHNFDFLVEKDGRLFRPWITVIQDYRSGKVLSWCPSIYPSSISIAVALYRMIVAYGAGEAFHCDNGKDYRSHIFNGQTKKMKVIDQKGIEREALLRLRGAIEICGMKTIFARPYSGRSKGRLERMFRFWAEYVSKRSGSWLGSNTVERPEDAQLYWRSIKGKAKRTEGILTWDGYMQIMEVWPVWVNANWRGEGKGMEGQTPDEVFEATRLPMKEISKDTLEMAFSRAEVRRVRGNCIEIEKIGYWAPELYQYSGQDLIVRRALGCTDYVVVMQQSGQFICRAVGSWFRETEELAVVNERVALAKRANLQVLSTMGVGRIEPPIGSRSLIEIALRDQSKMIPSSSNEKILPANEPEELAPRKSRLISPLDVGLNQNEEED
jgi:hypothetical protein